MDASQIIVAGKFGGGQLFLDEIKIEDLQKLFVINSRLSRKVVEAKDLHELADAIAALKESILLKPIDKFIEDLEKV